MTIHHRSLPLHAKPLKQEEKKKKRTQKKRGLKEKTMNAKCLKCDKSFKALSKFNRICKKCGIHNEGIYCDDESFIPLRNKG